MATEQITLQVDAETARVFQSASAEEKARVTRMFCMVVKRLPKFKPGSLDTIINQVNEKAAANNLTEEVLQEILQSEELYV